MLVTPILFAASITLGEILVAERRFFFYGLAPLLYNVGIVLGTVALSGLGIFGPAVGAVIGPRCTWRSGSSGMRRQPVPHRGCGRRPHARRSGSSCG